MGNPRRFFGCDHEIEIDGVIIPPRCAVEVTFRTHQQEFLLRPDPEATEIILGCFGRAYHRYPEVRVHVLSALSDHGCFVALPESAFALSSFMRDFLSFAATRLNGLRDRTGTFWERRFRAIPIADERALEDRFRYVLTQGTKENLVWSARDWPGVSSVKALLGGEPLVGRWRDRKEECTLRWRRRRKLARAAARGRPLELPKVPQVWREYPIELVPLPHWHDLKVGQRRALVASILEEDAAETRARHERDGTKPLGIRAILATDPRDRPDEPAKSPAPACHASTRKIRKAFRVAYGMFVDALLESREVVRPQLAKLGVPLHGTLPPLGNHPPLGPRRPDPPLVFEPAAPVAMALGPPAPA